MNPISTRHIHVYEAKATDPDSLTLSRHAELKLVDRHAEIIEDMKTSPLFASAAE